MAPSIRRPPPAVGDGDNVYLLVDAAGHPLIVGPAAHDAAAVGNPVRIGGVHRTTIPAVADLDAADFLVDAAGRLITVDYAVHQSRIGNGKFNQAELAKTTASEEEIVAWTVTNGKTGYLKQAILTVAGHASETLHIVFIKSNGTTIAKLRWIGPQNKELVIPFLVPPKLAGDGAVKFNATAQQSTTNQSTYEVTFVGWEE